MIMRLSHFFIICFLHFILCEKKYLFYDVNYGEGFNLRRDVYIRIVNFVRLLDQKDQWIIVLPSWNNIFHWSSADDISWSNFFDLKSLNILKETIEYKDLYKESNYKFEVNLAIHLKNHPNMFNGDFSSKADMIKCDNKDEIHQVFNLINVKETICINIRMDIFEFAEFFNYFVRKHNVYNSYYIHDAEKLIHGKFSEWSNEYWTVRRSMIFSKKLRTISDEFRKINLNSTDIMDKTVMPNDWRFYPWPLSPAKGGPYLGAHLRRADFIHDRENSFPNLKEVIIDLVQYCFKYKLNQVFLATDASEAEKMEIKIKCHKLNITVLYFYSEKKLHDGEIAIIEQIIAAHGRAFIGTFQSTFTFRIFEERQIMGFSSKTTHNYFCPERLHSENTDDDNCSRPTVWVVKLEPAYTLSSNEIKNEL